MIDDPTTDDLTQEDQQGQPQEQQIDSSNLSSVSYDPKTSTLKVTFRSGSTYAYSGVSPSTYQSLISASSPGQYFYASIRTDYPYVQV